MLKINFNKTHSTEVDLMKLREENYEKYIELSEENFNKEYGEYFINQKEKPTKDSKGNDINFGDNVYYIKLLRSESSNIPTFMRSKGGSSYTAQICMSINGAYQWVDESKMWQDYFYKGIEGLDYEYVDDYYIKEQLSKKPLFK